MELRYQNDKPSKQWIIGLPDASFKVDGVIAVTLNNPEPTTVKAAYKGSKVVLTFGRVCDGKAVLYALKGKRGWFEKPKVRFDHG